MGFRSFLNSDDGLWGTRKVFCIAAATMLGVVLTAALVLAGDLSPQPADSLSITNASTKLLPDDQPAESSWLSGFHVSGYASQTFGMWQNPHNARDETRSSNALSVSRTLLQVDENYRLNENNTFFAREWFVYEPPYAFNSSTNFTNSLVQSSYLSPFCGVLATPSSVACKTGRETSPSAGHFYNDLYNNYSVRDFWWQNKLGPLTTFVGNQIVVWGQSIAFRIGDVINPQDFLWGFGFANLEQSRNPQWMIHPILNLPEAGPFSSNFLEAVIQPGFQPQWWEDSFVDGRFSGPGDATKDGRADSFPAAFMRFYPHSDHFWDPSLVTATGPGPYPKFVTALYSGNNSTVAGKPGFYINCNANGLPSTSNGGRRCWANGGVVIGAPLLHTFFNCGITNPRGGGQIPLGLGGSPLPAQQKFFNPMPAGLVRPVTGAPGGCNLTLSHNNLPYGAAGDYGLWDFGPWHIPGMQPSNWNDGVRLHTLIGATELTALYYNDNMDGGAPTSRFGGPGDPYYTNLGRIDFMDIQEVGLTADRPLPVPGSVGEYLPIVGRAEALYVNHQPFNNDNPLAFSGIRYSDVFKWMVALDIDSAYAPWLTSTGNLSAFFEVYDDITMDNSKLTPVGPLLSRPNDKNEVFALASIGTGWFWEDIEPTWTMIYQPKGTTFALFPTLVLNPPWTKKYFVKLQAIEVMGGDMFHGLGLFKGQSMLTAQFQYNFNLL